MLCNHHLYLVPKYFPLPPKETSYLLRSNSPCLFPQPLTDIESTFCLYGFPYSGHFIWMESYSMWLSVSDFLYLASILEVHPFVADVSPSFLFSIVQTCHILFVRPSTDGYLGCFHLLAILNNTIWTFVFLILKLKKKIGEIYRHKICRFDHFKVYTSVTLITSITLCSHHHSLLPNLFHHP